MAEQTGETLLGKLYTLVKNSPLMAVCVWMGYQQIKHEEKDEKKDAVREARAVEMEMRRKKEQEDNNKNMQDIIILMKEIIDKKYEKDTAK